MKKTSSFFLILYLLTLGPGFCQTASARYFQRRKPFADTRKKTILKISPFHFFDNSFCLAGEFFLSPIYKNSLLVTVVGSFQDQVQKSDKGFSIEFGGRYYPIGFNADTSIWYRNQSSGFYMGYGAQFGMNEYKTNQSFYDYNNLVGSKTIDYTQTRKSMWVTPYICFGYQLTIFEAFFLDIFVGGGVKLNQVDKSTFPNMAGFDLENEQNPNIFNRYYKGILPKLGFTIGMGF